MSRLGCHIVPFLSYTNTTKLGLEGFWHDVESWYSGLHPAGKGRIWWSGVQFSLVQVCGCRCLLTDKRYRVRGNSPWKGSLWSPSSLGWRRKQSTRKTPLDRLPKELKRNNPELTLSFPCNLYKCTDAYEETASFVNWKNSKVPVSPFLLIQELNFPH